MIPLVEIRPARCGNPSPTGRSLIGWRSYIDPAHPGGHRFSSPDQKYFNYTLQLRQPRGENGVPLGRHRLARCGSPSPASRSLIGWWWYIQPARSREDRVSTPDHKYFHTSTNPTTRRRKRPSPGSIPPRTVWKPQPNWLVGDWLRLVEPARGESCPLGTTSRSRRTRGG